MPLSRCECCIVEQKFVSISPTRLCPVQLAPKKVEKLAARFVANADIDALVEHAAGQAIRQLRHAEFFTSAFEYSLKSHNEAQTAESSSDKYDSSVGSPDVRYRARGSHCRDLRANSGWQRDSEAIPAFTLRLSRSCACGPFGKGASGLPDTHRPHAPFGPT